MCLPRHPAVAYLFLVRPNRVTSFLDKLKIDGSKFETPLTIRHVESHLIFSSEGLRITSQVAFKNLSDGSSLSNNAQL